MRFMMLMKPNIAEETDWSPSAEAVAAMSRYNEQLREAGVLLSLDGLQPSSKGARVSFAGEEPAVSYGPFTEIDQLIGGYWMIDVKSLQEAVEWATRCPASEREVIEVRQVYEMSDFPPEVQAAATG